jgi:hypothetical protein
LLRVDERPNFVELNATAFQISERAILIIETRSHGINEQLGDRIVGYVRKTICRAKAAPLAKQVKDLRTLFRWELVHASIYNENYA